VDGVQVYAEYGNVQPTRRSSNHAYAPGYGDAWPSEAAAQPPPPGQSQSQSQIVNYNGSESPGVVIEQRKIIIRNLDRAGLSEATVLDLITQHTGIMGTTAAGQIERVEVRINNDGRARGTAFVTFCAPELARIAVAALEGREVGDRQISARFTTEGVSSGGFSSRPGRRLAGGGGGGGGMNARLDGGAASKHSRSSRGHASASRSAVAAVSAPPSAAASVSGLVSVGNGSLNEKKEGPPVVVDGSGGRWKKEMPPVVVDGSAGKQVQGVALW
jgi:hypothetical protein